MESKKEEETEGITLENDVATDLLE